MATTIQIKRGTGSAVPSGLADGELAINLDSGKLYFGSGSTSVDNFTFGELTAEKYIVSSSVLYVTTSFSSGSTEFGDTADDTHTFTGNITASGNISSSGIITAEGLIISDDASITDELTVTGNITSSANIKANRFVGDARNLTNVPNDLVWDGTVGDGHLQIITCQRYLETGFITEAQFINTSSLEWTDTGFGVGITSPVIYTRDHDAVEIPTNISLATIPYIVFSGSNFQMNATLEGASSLIKKIDLNALDTNNNGKITDIVLLGAIKDKLIELKDDSFNPAVLNYNIQDSYLISSNTGNPHQIALSTFYAADPSDTEVFSFHYFTSESSRRGGGAETTQIFDITTNPNKVYSSLVTDLDTVFSSSVDISGSLGLTGGTLTAEAAVLTTADINGGTIDGITSLTAGGNLDIGAHDLRAATLTADGLTSGRIIFAGTAGVLSDDADLTFATDTLTVTKIANVNSTSHITASGNISASGNIIAASLDAAAVSDALAAAIIAEIDNDEIPIAKLAEDAVTVTAGTGLTGGGSITLGGSATVNVIGGTGVTANANDIAIGQDVATTANVIFNHITASGNISSSGTVTAENITVAADLTVADNILHSGDTDTKIAFGTNTLSIKAGNTSVFESTITGSKLTNTHQIIYDTGSVALAANSAMGDIVKFGGTTTTAGGVYFLNGSGGWTLTQANAAATSTGSLAVAVGTNSTTHGMCLRGFVNPFTDPSAGIGSPVYLSDTHTGRMLATPPSDTNDVVRIVGYQYGPDLIYFNPSNDYIVHA
jgi:hypothetical protein